MCKNKVVNAGKTTLITRLLPVLTDYGLKVATVKHDGHEFEGDVPGTDTYRHMKAGAFGTAVFYKYAKQMYCRILSIVETLKRRKMNLLENIKQIFIGTPAVF